MIACTSTLALSLCLSIYLSAQYPWIHLKLIPGFQAFKRLLGVCILYVVASRARVGFFGKEASCMFMQFPVCMISINPMGSNLFYKKLELFGEIDDFISL